MVMVMRYTKEQGEMVNKNSAMQSNYMAYLRVQSRAVDSVTSSNSNVSWRREKGEEGGASTIPALDFDAFHAAAIAGSRGSSGLGVCNNN
jgi:hypothetical protein